MNSYRVMDGHGCVQRMFSGTFRVRGTTLNTCLQNKPNPNSTRQTSSFETWLVLMCVTGISTFIESAEKRVGFSFNDS